jgi:hypothetical protein
LDSEHIRIIREYEEAAKEYGEIYLDECYRYLQIADWSWMSMTDEREKYQVLKEDYYRYKESIDGDFSAC